MLENDAIISIRPLPKIQSRLKKSFKPIIVLKLFAHTYLDSL